ncbi:MAG: metal-binding protein [Myxococcota bacterium]
MASGRRHQTINLLLIATVGGLIATAMRLGYEPAWMHRLGLEWPAVVAFCGAYLFGTFFVTPDLDLAEQHVLAKRNWGWFGFMWVPYGLLFSHRGISHGWFLGPLTRLLYLVAVAALVVFGAYMAADALDRPLPRVNLPARISPLWMWPVGAAVAGFYVSQWSHSIADGVGPWHGLKRLFRRGRRRRRR